MSSAPAARADGTATTARPLVRAQRRPLQVIAVVTLVAACAVGVARCDTDGRILAALAGVAATALLVPTLRANRGTLPLALVVGAVPALLSLRAHAFPAYDVAFAGVLLVVCAECANRSWYVHSTAPRQLDSRWAASVVVLAAGGALAAAAVVGAASVRLHGAVLLSAIGAGALVVTGLLAFRSADDE